MEDLTLDKSTIESLKALVDEKKRADEVKQRENKFTELMNSNDETIKLLKDEGILSEIIADNPHLKTLGEDGFKTALSLSKVYIDKKKLISEMAQKKEDVKVDNPSAKLAENGVKPEVHNFVNQHNGSLNLEEIEKFAKGKKDMENVLKMIQIYSSGSSRMNVKR